MDAGDFGIGEFERTGALVRHVADLDQRHGRGVGAGALIGEDDGLSRLPGLDVAVLVVEEEAVGAAGVGVAVDGKGRGGIGGQIGRCGGEAGVPLSEGVGAGARRTVRIDDAEVGGVERGGAAGPPPDGGAVRAVIRDLMHHGVADGGLCGA